MSQRHHLRLLRAATSILTGAVLAASGSPSSLRAQNTLPGTLRSVVYHNAPYFIQETHRVNDQIWPVDYDGDLYASNNRGPYVDPQGYHFPTVANATPKVYYSVVETGYGPDDGYYLIGYYHYHMQDDGFTIFGQMFSGHPNDMEGVWIALKKSSFWPYGKPMAALTEAHGALIPFYSDVLPDYPVSPQGGWAGRLQSWMDNRYGYNRPVIGVAVGTHGTYAAQDCSGGTQPDYSHGIGMWRFSVENFGTYRACIRAGYDAIVYYPMLEEALIPSMGLPYPEQLPFGQTGGLGLYALEEMTQSVLWQHRSDFGLLFSGTPTGLAGGLTGYNFFNGPNGSHDANPPWAWLGGPGEGQFGIYWYGWWADGKPIGYNQGNLQYSPAGALLGGASGELARRFPYFPDVHQPDRFNPYVASPPDYNSYVPPLTASIGGPTSIVEGDYRTWTAIASGGTGGGYTYQWSGVMSGIGPTISGSPSSGELYLDVWDGAGRHTAVSTYISAMMSCPGSQIIC